MHEMVMIHKMLAAVLDECKGTNVASVTAINVTIGEATDIVDEFVQDMFQFLARDTLAQGATLNVSRTPLRVQCNQCGAEFPIKIRCEESWTCSHCGAYHDYHLISGREFRIDSFEVTYGPVKTECDSLRQGVA